MKKVLFVGLLIVLVLTIAACTPAATPTSAPPTSAPAATTAPTAAPTAPPPACAKLPNPPTAAAGQLGAPDKPIVITFVPSGDTTKITKAGTAIADCLTKMTGLTYQIQVGTANSASIEAMGAGKAQFGFLNTFSVLLAEKKYGVVPVLVAARKYATNDIDPDKAMAGQLTTFYKGQFITKKDSGIKQISDLKGKTFCFVDPTSTSGSIIPRLVLKANGVDPDKDLKSAVNAGSHPNVAIAVYKGDCDAGATFIDARTDSTVQKAAPDIMDKTAVFFDTDKIPNDGMQVVKDLDPKIRDITVAGVLAMVADPGGIAVLNSLYGYNSMQKVDPNFYDPFLQLMIKAGADPSQFVK